MQWQRNKRSTEPVVPRAGPRRIEALRSFQTQIYRETFNSKRKVHPESMARALKRLFQRDCDALSNLEVEAEDLFDRLQQLNYERERLYNQRYHFCIQDNWLEDMPLMFSVKIGGPANTMEFVGGRNSLALNKTLESFRQLSQASGGDAIRALVEKMCEQAKGPAQKFELDKNVTTQYSAQQLVKSILKFSCEGVRSSTGCLLIQSKESKSEGSLDSGEPNESKAVKNKNKISEVQILFAHLLAWAQLRMLQSRPEMAQFLEPSWLSDNSGNPVPIPTIWKKFNLKFRNQSPEVWASLRFHMRSLLFTCMPQKNFQDDCNNQTKAADLQIFALKHLQTKQGASGDIPDDFLRSSLCFDKYRQKPGVNSTSETTTQRAAGKAFPGDLSKKQRKIAVVSMGFVFAKKKIFHPTTSKTPGEAQANAQSFLDLFQCALQGGTLITDIFPDHQVSSIHTPIDIF